MLRFPAVSRALEASLGRLVRTTEAAIVRGASDVSVSSSAAAAASSSSGMRFFGDEDIVAGIGVGSAVKRERGMEGGVRGDGTE
jgi:hypothetical protein